MGLHQITFHSTTNLSATAINQSHMLFKGFQGSSLKDNCRELQNKQAQLVRGGNSNACNSRCCNNLYGCEHHSVVSKICIAKCLRFTTDISRRLETLAKYYTYSCQLRKCSHSWPSDNFAMAITCGWCWCCRYGWWAYSDRDRWLVIYHTILRCDSQVLLLLLMTSITSHQWLTMSLDNLNVG